MAEFKRNLDYVDVAARLQEMREKYPELSMQQVSMEFKEFGGKSWVVYTAAAFRTPDDNRPGIGTAWEPVPGPTPYTRDSEVQNAETSAWGRALIAIGASTKNGIASAEEVSNRSGNESFVQSGNATTAASQVADTTKFAAVSNDPRIDLILRAAQEGDNEFLASLASQFVQKGTLTEKQIDSGARQAQKIISVPRSAPVREEIPFEPVGGFSDEPF